MRVVDAGADKLLTWTTKLQHIAQLGINSGPTTW